MKDAGKEHKISWSIRAKTGVYTAGAKFCDVCLTEKTHILLADPKESLNIRTEILEVEQNEYDILTSFLPKQLSEEETKKICADVISKIGANSLKAGRVKVNGEIETKRGRKLVKGDKVMFLKNELIFE